MKDRNSKNGKGGKHESASISIVFEDNTLLPMLYGDGDAHLSRLEKHYNVNVSSRGNVLAIDGKPQDVEAARQVLEVLYADLRKGSEVYAEQVDAAMRMHDGKARKQERNGDSGSGIFIKTMKKTVKPYSAMQEIYIKALGEKDLVFSIGPAGTGKTYLAVAMAVELFNSGKVEKIILSRPAVEAGEKLGFLPGDLKEKVDPYLRPLYDALFDMMPAERLNRYMENGEIEVAPLAFMRGRTFSNAFIILDEAQNTTATQMKMFLTRLGQGARMVVTGDLTQTDLPRDVKSGLADATRKLSKLTGVEIVRFSDLDVVRHKLAARIIQAYDEWDRKKSNPSAE